MKKSIAILVISIISVYCANIFATIYVDKLHHFKINYTNYWEQISSQSLCTYNKMLSDSTGESASYDAAFKLKGKPDFEYPYIYILTKKTESLSLNSFLKELKSSEFKQNLPKSISDIVTNIKPGESYYDSDKHIIYMKFEANVKYIGSVQGIWGMIFGDNTIVSIFCYSKSVDLELYISEFVRFIESCKFDKGYTYKP